MTTVEHVRISFPPGTRLAVIDLDGTLLKGMNAERLFNLHLLVTGHISIFQMIGFLLSLLGDIVRMGFRPAIVRSTSGIDPSRKIFRLEYILPAGLT